MKLIIADAQPLYRRGLKTILACIPELEVVAECDDGRAAVEYVRRERPDLAIVDTCLNHLDGLATIRELQTSPSPPAVLAISAHGSWRVVSDALVAGALCFALKTDPDEIIVEALHATVERTRFLSPNVDVKVRRAVGDGDGGARDPFNALTFRQRTVLRLVLRGRSSASIAALLGLSLKTVDSHRAHINRKLNCSSVSDLIRLAAVNGLLPELDACPPPCSHAGPATSTDLSPSLT